jgi:hypothetical protein
MQRKSGQVDIINDVLEACIAVYPANGFLKSLLAQYEERGGLSKKQLEGLYQKASKVSSIPSAKLATLEAEILKRPNRYKSEPPPIKPVYEKDKEAGELIKRILDKYPQHKRVLFLQSKYENNEVISPAEVSELKRFAALLKPPPGPLPA